MCSHTPPEARLRLLSVGGVSFSSGVQVVDGFV